MHEIPAHDKQRRLVMQAASASFIAMGFASLRQALAQGQRPPGMYRVQGSVRVNGRPVQRGQPVNPGDTVQTGARSEAVFVIGQDAFLMRASSQLETAGTGMFADVLRLTTGKLLSVFSPGQRRLETHTATVGIRGTGVYMEVQPKRTYVCTCYGNAVLAPRDMPKMSESVATEHHEQPRFIYADKSMPEDKMMPKAPVVNHTDTELVVLETLVGRLPPFVGRDYPQY